jgi:hypothetical protein
VKKVAPGAVLLNSIAGTSNFEVIFGLKSGIQLNILKVPKKGSKLSKIFTAFEENKEKYHISDWGISNTSNFYITSYC